VIFQTSYGNLVVAEVSHRVQFGFHLCAPRGPAALAVGGIGAGEQRGRRWLSVSFRRVRGMSERRFRRTLGGVSSPGLHMAWCPKYRRRILGGRVARRLNVLLGQVADEHGWQIVVKEVMPDLCTCWYGWIRPMCRRR
jgi:hypothetical protein